MKFRFFLVLALIITTISCQDDDQLLDQNNLNTEDVLTERKDINTLLLELSNNEEGKLDWRKLSDDQLWAAYQFANKMTVVGWDENAKGTTQRNQILNYVRESEGLDNNELIVNEFEGINTMVLKVAKKETLLGLKRMTRIIDLFEIGYEASSPEEYENTNIPIKSQNSINKSALGNTTLHGVNVNYPARFDFHNIRSGWNNGLTGDNIGIAIIDSGSQRGDNTFGEHRTNTNGLNPAFLRKSHSLDGFVGYCWWFFGVRCRFDGPYDRFGSSHGTDMAKTAAAPMGTGVPTGVAYASDVRIVRGSHTILIGPFNSLMSTTRAYDNLANRNEIKIISMSLGRVFWSGMLARAIRRNTNNGKLVFNAAGTLVDPRFATDLILSLVGQDRNFTLFPARMNETIACTGVINDSSTWCNKCHGKADFITEFESSDGSSSNSTSTTAGIAALIWGENPSMSAGQVLNKMKDIAEYGNKNAWRGYGRIDLNKYNQRTPTVHLRKRNASNYALDGNWGGRNGQNIHMWSSNPGHQNQQWIEHNRGNGFYSYQKKGTNYCIDGNNGGGNGQNVYLWQCDANNVNQHWKKVDRGNNVFNLIKRGTNHSLDGNAGGANGINVHLWDSNSNNQNQQWIISEI